MSRAPLTGEYQCPRCGHSEEREVDPLDVFSPPECKHCGWTLEVRIESPHR